LIEHQVEWAQLQPGGTGDPRFEELDRVVNAANAGGIKVLLSVINAPAWSRPRRSTGLPDNPADYGAVLGSMALRYQGRVQAYECWNEENLASNVGPGKIDPGAYLQLLKACYRGVKSADPRAIVVSGAPTPTGIDDPRIAMDDLLYLQRLYAINGGEASRYFDALGAHPEAFANAPDETLTRHRQSQFSNHPSFYLDRIREYRALMVAAGDGNKQIFATEFGYDSSDTIVPGYEYSRLVSQQEQGDYLARAFEKAATDYAPWVGMMMIWNLNFQAVVPSTDEKWGWGVMRGDFTPRPAYSALQAMPKG